MRLRKETMELNIKATHKVIKEYYRELNKLKKIGEVNEGAVAPYFANILRHYSKQFNWILIEKYQMESKKESIIYPDGAIVDEFKLLHGIWEAKDTKDKLENEVKKKFEKGYPRENIIFQEPSRIIIWQNGNHVGDYDISNKEKIVEALKIFFEYKPPEFIKWEIAVEEFKNKIPELAESLLKLIEREHKTNKEFKKAFKDFEELCRESINPELSKEAIEEMLIQHLLTERLFRKVFNNPDFRTKNIIAAEIEKVINTLTSKYFDRHEFLKKLNQFYQAIEITASSIDDYTQKQDFMNTVYEKFFQGFSLKVADTHGIVYTPQPVVEFMVNSVEEILQKEFNSSISDENVHILDPFVGTGNFILKIMRTINKTNLEEKYNKELHCNEVMLLPYYIASMNIEHLYYEITGKYEPFEGICLVDTFDLVKSTQHNLEFLSKKNTERIELQKNAPIKVIISNPPYNASQVNENDNNKNRKYPALDKRIHETYTKDSNATLKSKLSDPYIKAIRFASDRIKKNGVIAFISNNSFIKSFTFDGMRKNLENDFNRIYIIDLQGDIRKDSMRDGIPLGEKHTVFGKSAMVGISITFFIKGEHLSDHKIYYTTVNFRATRQDKFEFLRREKNCTNIDYKQIKPNENYYWLNEGIKGEFNNFIPIGTNESRKSNKVIVDTIFNDYSLGVSTNRDPVVYDLVETELENRIRGFCYDYNSEVDRYRRISKWKKLNVDQFVRYDKVKWSSTLKNKLERGKYAEYNDEKIRKALYRPFTNKLIYYDKTLIDRPGHFRRYFPSSNEEDENRIICVSGIAHKKRFQTLITNRITSLDYLEKTQCFPFYIYDKDGRYENISDWALSLIHI